MKTKKKTMTPLERARQRLKKMQERGGKNENMIDLEMGKNVVRALPGPTEDDDFYAETAYHHGIGPNGETRQCPGAVGNKCPLCARAKKAKKHAYELKDKFESGGEKNIKIKKAMEKAFKLANNLKARPRFFFNVVPLQLGKETFSGKEVKILAVGPQIMQGIFTYVTDTDEYGNVLDLKKGRDFIIVKKSKAKGGKKPKPWDVEYEVKLRDKDRCFVVHSNRLKELHDLNELIGEYPTYDELVAVMEGTSEDDDGDDDEDKEDRHTKKLASKKGKKRASEEEDEDESEDEDDDTDSEDEDEEDDSSDDDDDDSDEGEDEDESEDEEEEDDEDEKPKKKKSSSKKKAKDEDEEEEEDEEDESEEEDDSDEGEEDEEDDSDEDEEEDDDSEEEEEEDEDDEKPKKKSALKKKLKSKAGK